MSPGSDGSRLVADRAVDVTAGLGLPIRVPDSVRASWFGHTLQVNVGIYTHASAADLDVISDALGKIFQSAV